MVFIDVWDSEGSEGDGTRRYKEPANSPELIDDDVPRYRFRWEGGGQSERRQGVVENSESAKLQGPYKCRSNDVVACTAGIIGLEVT